VVAPVVWQLDVWGLQSIHKQGHASTGQLPFLMLHRPQSFQTISNLYVTCPVAATVTILLWRFCQAMTGYLPEVSVASLLAADTPSEQLPSDALLQTWHRLRLAVLHSIWAASQIAQASRPTQPPDASEPYAILASSPSSQQASPASSTNSHHGHLARQLVLKTVKAMIRNDWTKCNKKHTQKKTKKTGQSQSCQPMTYANAAQTQTRCFVFVLFFLFWLLLLYLVVEAVLLLVDQVMCECGAVCTVCIESYVYWFYSCSSALLCYLSSKCTVLRTN